MVLGFITSQAPSDPTPSDVALRSADPDFADTGLRTDSTLRLHRLLTVTTGVIRRELGHVPLRVHREINKKLRELFGL